MFKTIAITAGTLALLVPGAAIAQVDEELPGSPTEQTAPTQDGIGDLPIGDVPGKKGQGVANPPGRTAPTQDGIGDLPIGDVPGKNQSGS
jgi:hypothetical protein